MSPNRPDNDETFEALASACAVCRRRLCRRGWKDGCLRPFRRAATGRSPVLAGGDRAIGLGGVSASHAASAAASQSSRIRRQGMLLVQRPPAERRPCGLTNKR